MGYDILYLKQIVVKKYPFIDFSSFDFDDAINDTLLSCNDEKLSFVKKKLME